MSKPSDDDETDDHVFTFEDVAAGAYKISVSDGWRYRIPQGDEGTKGATGMLGDALSPLGGDLSIDVTPSTATVYGRVDGGDGFPLDSVTVTVNGRTGMTDDLGRYIIDGVSAVRGKVFISAAAEGQQGSKADSTSIEFAMNSVTRHDLDLSAVTQTASISGTVRASGTNDPVANVEITVTGSTVTNLVKGKLTTDTDGNYTAIVEAVDLGGTVTLSASKEGWTFVPASLSAPAHAGAAISGIDFTGFMNATISGRVIAPGGGPQMDVAVTATSTTDTTLVISDTTGVTGTFSLNVPFGGYTIAASLENHIFDGPATGWVVNVAPGQSVSFGDIKAKTAGALGVRAARMRNEDDETTDGVDESQTWAATISLMYTATAGDVPVGYADATYQPQTSTDDGETWTDVTGTQVQTDATPPVDVPGSFTIPNPSDGEFMVRVIANASNDGAVDPEHTVAYADTSATATVAEIDPSASGVSAARVADTVSVSWSAVTDGESQFRILVQVDAASVGAVVWVVADGGTPDPLISTTRSWSLTVADDFTASWSTIGGTSVALTAADLNKALMVRVDARQDTVDEGEDGSTDTWTEEREGTAVTVDAKPDDG